MVIQAVFYFCLGAIVGSYLNVLILRYNTGRSSGGRSRCMSCLKTLEWYELVPIFSYVFQRGRCRMCTSKVSIQYPLVEFASAALFLLIFLQEPPILEMLALFLIATLFLFVVVYDLKHLIIPQGPMYGLIVLSFASLFIVWNPLAFSLPTLGDFLMGPILFSFFAALYMLSSGRAVGFGDAKLSLAIGWFLGFPGGISAFILSFWIGATVGVILLLATYLQSRARVSKSPVGKHESGATEDKVYFSYEPPLRWHRKSEIPFAPFLAVGTFLVFFFHVSVVAL